MPGTAESGPDENTAARQPGTAAPAPGGNHDSGATARQPRTAAPEPADHSDGHPTPRQPGAATPDPDGSPSARQPGAPREQGPAAGAAQPVPPGPPPDAPAILRRLADWAARLDLDDAPARVVDHLKAQILSQLAAARAGYAHPLGARITRAYGGPLQDDPERAVRSLCMATVCLDFDDTAYAGHLSHSTVNVPLLYAKPLGLDGRRLLTAVLAAGETAARITAAATLGPFRGQTAGHTHLAGAVAGRLRAEDADAGTWAHALGMAFSVPTWTLSRGFFTTDAKLLVAAVPVQIGLSACDGARHGLTGPEDILEHPDGFLRRFADVPLPEEALAGLGSLWHTETFSYKVHPGSAYISAAVDCAIELHHALADTPPEHIAEVVVEGSLFTAGLDRIARRHPIGPDSSVAALNFSLPYNIATALLTGALLPTDLAPPAVTDPDRWTLASRIRTAHAPAFTRRALLSTAPLGQALRRAGPQAEPWLRAIDPTAAETLPPTWLEPETDFRWATKNLGARLTVRLTDGRELSTERWGAVGAAGGAGVAGPLALARAKFLACGGDPYVVELVERLDDLHPGEVRLLVDLALAVPDAPAPCPTVKADVPRAGDTRTPRKGPAMETSTLEDAYVALIAAATAATHGGPPDERGIEWTLAHIALSERLLASTARQVLAGTPAGLDNGPAMDPKAVADLISSAGPDVLVDLVRRNAAEFVGLLARTPRDRGAVPVSVRLVGDDGEEVFSGPVPWAEIVRMRAEEHIPGHTNRIHRLSRDS